MLCFPVKRIIGPRHKNFLTNWIGNFILTLIRQLMKTIINVTNILRSKKTGFCKAGGGHSVFCNPPYGREIGKWVEKAYRTNEEHGDLVVMLLPARTDTKWFHDFIYHKAEIRFVKGRIKFGGSTSGAPFPSMVIIYRQKRGVKSGKD